MNDNKKKSKYYSINTLVQAMMEFENAIRHAFMFTLGIEDKHEQTKGE